MNSQGDGNFVITNARPRSQAKLTTGEREVLRTLRFVVFAS
jgi:hypothetical protein